ncbi:MAG: hypothetical protein A2Y17_05290 [Clostridiales bacterium GWF2_38_85]|nr:MAG: hypothetical protein A2Y17_05290 [Clostridiales bacterium GWF2_38_85]HBL83356.1 hypothetical protein [Clostridiales bacterium]
MYNTELKNKLINFAKKSDIDLIGFASKDRFEGLDPRYNPFSIFPEGETVILVGKRICRGSLRGVEEGSNFGDYGFFGSAWLDDEFLAIACYDMTRQLEDEGWEAVPVYNNPPESYGMGVPVSKDKIAPNVAPDFDYAFVACGLGEISYSGLKFTKEYGSRQLFQMVITDAKLEPDPILEGNICDRCGKCADICPLGAISKTEFEDVTICSKTMRVAKIDYNLCRSCKNGCRQNRHIAKAKPDMIPAICNRTCMIHLEEEGLVGNKFANNFRKREAWGFDILSKPVQVKE